MNVGPPPVRCPRCGQPPRYLCVIQGAYCDACERRFEVTEEQLRQAYGVIERLETVAADEAYLERCFAIGEPPPRAGDGDHRPGF